MWNLFNHMGNLLPHEHCLGYITSQCIEQQIWSIYLDNWPITVGRQATTNNITWLPNLYHNIQTLPHLENTIIYHCEIFSAVWCTRIITIMPIHTGLCEVIMWGFSGVIIIQVASLASATPGVRVAPLTPVTWVQVLCWYYSMLLVFCYGDNLLSLICYHEHTIMQHAIQIVLCEGYTQSLSFVYCFPLVLVPQFVLLSLLLGFIPVAFIPSPLSSPSRSFLPTIPWVC